MPEALGEEAGVPVILHLNYGSALEPGNQVPLYELCSNVFDNCLEQL
jgi:hypothetical protein